MRKLLLTISALAACSSYSYAAAIGLNLYVETLRDASGNPLPDGALVQVVVDTSNNGFGNPGRPISPDQLDPAFGSVIEPLSFVGGSVDDVVVASFAISSANSGTSGGLFESLNINYDAGFYKPGVTITQGLPMLMRWWPGKTVSSPGSSVQPGNRFGEYRSNTALDGSDIPWITPSVGGNFAINVRNVGNPDGGSATVAHTSARLTPVPEPSSAVLLGLGVLGFLARRRK